MGCLHVLSPGFTQIVASSSRSKNNNIHRCRCISSLSSSSSSMPIPKKKLQQKQLRFKVEILENFNDIWIRMVEAFVDSVFEFSKQTLLPSQSNFAPAEELGAPVAVTSIEGSVPEDFPEGIYIRNGSNPVFGGLQSAQSVFGRSNHIWVEGEGMLHALYFNKHHEAASGSWNLLYNSRFVETDTFKVEKLIRNRPSFLPAAEGDSLAVLFAYLFNLLRFGKANQDLGNTSVFEHSGKLFSIAETHLPLEIDPWTLQTLGYWNAWNYPSFSSHPKKAPATGELVTMGISATKPFMVVGVISEDGKQLVHKVDVKLKRCTLSHEIGVTQRYNVILDYPLTINLNRLIRGGPLIKYNKEEYSRIGVMPRYGDAESIEWFEVEPNCTLHLFNCFEDGDEVVVWGCKAVESIIPKQERGKNKFEWLKGLVNVREENEELVLSRAYEWRLNLKTRRTQERYLTQFSMDFPFINSRFTALYNRFGYAQILDSSSTSESGMLKFGGLAKLHFEEREPETEMIKVEYHMFEKGCFCSGASFVCKEEAAEEDDGWIITHVHNEITNISQVYIIDAKEFSKEPVARITLPHRVPYGFHGAFFPMSCLK